MTPRKFAPYLGTILKNNNIPIGIQQHLFNLITFPVKRHKNIADYFINYQTTAYNWDPGKPPKCLCDEYSSIFPDRAPDTHIHCQASQLNITDKSIFGTQSKTVLRPTNLDITLDIITSLAHFAREVSPILRNFNKPCLPNSLPTHFPYNMFGQKHYAQIYHPVTRKFTGSIDKDRVLNLFQQFFRGKQCTLDLSINLFIPKLIDIFIRYSSFISEKHWKTPSTFLSLIAKVFSLTIECFASPLDWSFETFSNYLTRNPPF